MEVTDHALKRKREDAADNADMDGSNAAASSNDQPRKKIKAKRRLQQPGTSATANPEMEENKEDLDNISFEDSQEDEFEVEDVVQRPDDSDDEENANANNNDDWEDCDDDDSSDNDDGAATGKKGQSAKSGKDDKPVIWDDKKEPLKEGEELEYDGSAYVMLHRSKVEWPCLSIDYLVRERCTTDGFTMPVSTWFPSQANG